MYHFLILKVHDILMQYFEYLMGVLDMSAYKSMLPPLQSLYTDFGINFNTAFFLVRPILSLSVKVREVESIPTLKPLDF